MSGAVQLAASRRLRTARAALDAQRLTEAVLRTQGAAGKKGEKGDIGPMPDHEWQGTKLRFEKPAGGWGEYVELRGPKGARGTNGAPGGGGGGDARAPTAPPLDLDALPPASSAPPVEFVVRQGDAWVRASFAQMLGWLQCCKPAEPLPPCHVTVNGQGVTAGGVEVVIGDCATDLPPCAVTVNGAGVVAGGVQVVVGDCGAVAVEINGEAVTVDGVAVTVNGGRNDD